MLQGIDLELEKGNFVAIVGPSGGGKTTLLNRLTGADRPTSVMVFVDGAEVGSTSERKLTRWRGRNVGIVFQFFQLLPTMSKLEDVIIPIDFFDVYKRTERRGKGMELLERFD